MSVRAEAFGMGIRWTAFGSVSPSMILFNTREHDAAGTVNLCSFPSSEIKITDILPHTHLYTRLFICVRNMNTYIDDNIEISVNNGIVYGNKCKVVGNKNRVLGDSCEIIGDDNIICGANCIVSGYRNVIKGRQTPTIHSDGFSKRMIELQQLKHHVHELEMVLAPPFQESKTFT